MRTMSASLRAAFLVVLSSVAGYAQSGDSVSRLAEPRDYVQKRLSSYDRTGGNADFRTIAPGETLTLMDETGPGNITHIWFTLATGEAYHLKKLVLRMYWDGEATPSVETPLGDFFGLGLGEYYVYESTPLSVAPNRALNAFFPMPFEKRARITVTNMGKMNVDAFYYNIDFQAFGKPLAADTLYFHAQYRQASPNQGFEGEWKDNGDPVVSDKKNLSGERNYVWMEATGRGHFVGVTMSVLQNQDYWWGEGDDMFFVDGAMQPAINGTGSEDYLLGAYSFGGKPFSYALYGAPVVGEEKAGSRSSVYRFHLDSPIPFTKSLKATIEHGHANTRSDNYFSVAYWYQTEPHAAFPELPPVEDRLPQLHVVGGPGNNVK
jgi:D-arabinan exo alpha-(1,3)/(1,5)-arabinofuranosidase (non-reducing end)